MQDKHDTALHLAVLKLRKNIKQLLQKGRSINEEDTKRALINPMIGVLGWDLEDLDEVRNEYRYTSKSNPVDYALFIAGDPVLFVEAKPLKTGLDDQKWITQTISYAVTAGVEWCVLTNGQEYRLYNSHALVDAQGKLFRALRLSDSAEHGRTVATLDLLSKNKMQEKQLSVLWKAHFIDRSVKAALEEMVDSQDPSLVRLLKKKTHGLTTGDVTNSLKRADMRLHFPVLAAECKAGAEDQRDIPRLVARNKRAHRGKHMPAQVPGKIVKKQGNRSPKNYNVSLTELINIGLIYPPTRLETRYRKQDLQATILNDGRVEFGGNLYDSLSSAAGYARNSVIGPPGNGQKMHQTNGWTFWKLQDEESGKLVEIKAIRERMLKK